MCPDIVGTFGGTMFGGCMDTASCGAVICFACESYFGDSLGLRKEIGAGVILVENERR